MLWRQSTSALPVLIAVGAAFSAALATSSAHVEVDPKDFEVDTSGDPPTGCLFYGFRLYPDMKNLTKPVRPIASAMQCQQVCQSIEGCGTFNYVVSSSSCYLGSSEHTKVEYDEASVAGPVHCQRMPSSCTASLPAQFPGNTPAETLQVSSTGLVPPKLQCWPRDHLGTLKQCATEPIKVLEDLNAGWAAQCDGLVKVSLSDGETCEESCRASTTCPSWQLLNSTWDGLQCWQGLGYNCFNTQRGLKPLGAQRFQRGHVRVLKDLTGIQVMGLVLSFSLEGSSSPSDFVSRCRSTCYSSLHCSVWILSRTYGCYVEDTLRSTIPWPPTTSTFDASTELAKTVIAGEYIQHQCGQFENPTVGSGLTASCSAYPKCSGLSGLCCPSSLGVDLECCKQGGKEVSAFAPASPSIPSQPIATPQTQQKLMERKVVSFTINNLAYSKLSPSEVDGLGATYGALVSEAAGAPGKIQNANAVAGRVSLRPKGDEAIVADAELGAAASDANVVQSTLAGTNFQRAVSEATYSAVSKEAILGPLAVSSVSARNFDGEGSPFAAEEREKPAALQGSNAAQAPATAATAPASALATTEPTAASNGGKSVGEEAALLFSGAWWHEHGMDVSTFIGATVVVALLVGGAVACFCFRSKSKKGKRQSTRSIEFNKEDSDELLEEKEDGESVDGEYDSGGIPLFGAPNLQVPTLANTTPSFGQSQVSSFGQVSPMYMARPYP